MTVYVPTVSVSTSDVLVFVTVSRSVAVLPASTYASPSSTVAGLSPMIVITGAVVSTTLTVLVAVAVLPLASVAVYVTVYVPTVSVSTVPAEVTVTVSKSDAVAPASVYVAPSSTVAGLSPVTVTTGAVVSTTLTVLVANDELPDGSVAV